MNYTCLVVDDHLIERDAIEMDLRKTGLLDIKATCADGLEASKVLTHEHIDIVFSDIDMPRLSGLELIRSLKRQPVFVFITAHAEHAAESFELDVIDFIVKPVTFERLLKSVNKAIEYLDLKKAAGQHRDQPPQQEAEAVKDDHFFIKENHDLIKLRFDDVAYIESMGHFSKIFTLQDKKHITLVGLKNLELILPSSIFTRVHRQYLVNHNHINVIGQGEVTLKDKYNVPVGLSYRQTLLDQVVKAKTVTRFSE